MRKLLFISLLVLFYVEVISQTKKQESLTRILFVFDASNSMVNKHGPVMRIEAAKDLFCKFIDSLSLNKNYQFALRMYGQTVKYPPGDCKDSKLVVPFGKNNTALIKQKVKEAKPTGITPIEHSLTESANDFPDKKATNMIILITDGIEECDGDPCRARQKLMEKGIVFKPFIIGIGLSPEQIKTFECVGTYFDYDDNTTFRNISNIITKQKLSKTSAQVNLLDINSKPSETNVNTTFYDVKNDRYVYNFMHTLNSANNPDTLYIDDYPTWKVVAHTIPPVESAETKLVPGKHTTIPISAPQGSLQINRITGAYNYNERVKCVVRKSYNMQTLNVQLLNTTEKYIVGEYDIEVLTLPRTYLYKVKIDQSKNTSVDILSAGVLNLKALEAGDGCILMENNSKLERVCNLSAATIQTYYLQPGNYKIEWRSKSLKGSIYTIEKKFTIQSDTQTNVDLFK